jgi:hypothetical protein
MGLGGSSRRVRVRLVIGRPRVRIRIEVHSTTEPWGWSRPLDGFEEALQAVSSCPMPLLGQLSGLPDRILIERFMHALDEARGRRKTISERLSGIDGMLAHVLGRMPSGKHP